MSLVAQESSPTSNMPHATLTHVQQRAETVQPVDAKLQAQQERLAAERARNANKQQTALQPGGAKVSKQVKPLTEAGISHPPVSQNSDNAIQQNSSSVAVANKPTPNVNQTNEQRIADMNKRNAEIREREKQLVASSPKPVVKQEAKKTQPVLKPETGKKPVASSVSAADSKPATLAKQPVVDHAAIDKMNADAKLHPSLLKQQRSGNNVSPAVAKPNPPKTTFKKNSK